MSEDSNFVYFKSMSPGFSYFAIVGGESDVPGISAEQPVETQPPVVTPPVQEPPVQPPATDTKKTEGMNIWIPIIIVVVIIILIAIGLMMRGKGKRKIPE